MNERSPLYDSNEQTPQDAHNQANDMLEAIMNRFESPLPLTSDEYCTITASVDRINDLFAEANLLQQRAEVMAHGDHIYLPQLTYNGEIWPEGAVRIPMSHATANSFGMQEGGFQGVSFAIDPDDSPTLYYRLQTERHEVDGFAYWTYADVRHSLLSFAADWKQSAAHLSESESDDDPQFHTHLETVTQFADDLRNNEGVDFKQVVRSIDFLLNKSSLGNTTEFRNDLAHLLYDSLPTDVDHWRLQASRAFEKQADDTLSTVYTPIESLSTESSILYFECHPRMNIHYGKDRATPRLRTNNQRFDLYFVAPSLTGTSAFFIPLSAIEDIEACDPPPPEG